MGGIIEICRGRARFMKNTFYDMDSCIWSIKRVFATSLQIIISYQIRKIIGYSLK